MLAWIIDWLRLMGGFELSPALEKTTLRAALAAGLSFLLAVAIGSRLVAWLRRHFQEPNVSPSARVAELHRHKAWTPTMGGLFIVLGIAGSTFFLADLANPFVLVSLLLVFALASLGAVDDLTKLRSRRR